MNTYTAYPMTAHQSSLLEAFFEEMKIRFSVKKDKKTDDTLFTKEAYFAMIDERIKSAECGNVHRLTPEVEKKLFGSIL